MDVDACLKVTSPLVFPSNSHQVKTWRVTVIPGPTLITRWRLLGESTPLRNCHHTTNWQPPGIIQRLDLISIPPPQHIMNLVYDWNLCWRHEIRSSLHNKHEEHQDSTRSCGHHDKLVQPWACSNTWISLTTLLHKIFVSGCIT